MAYIMEFEGGTCVTESGEVVRALIRVCDKHGWEWLLEGDDVTDAINGADDDQDLVSD